MDINKIIKMIDEDNSYVEFKYDDEKENIIIGAIKEKENPKGLGRYEFAIENKDEQKLFLNKISDRI